MNNPVEVQIPFDGFYESFASGYIDQVVEIEYEERDDEPDYTVDRDALAKAYLEAYSEWSEIPFLVYVELTSPAFYNFETDKIYAHIEFSDLEKLYQLFLKDENNQERINDRFASCSGFHSFYTKFCEHWDVKSLVDWDTNERSVLMPTPDFQEDIYSQDFMSEAAYNAVEFKIAS